MIGGGCYEQEDNLFSVVAEKNYGRNMPDTITTIM